MTKKAKLIAGLGAVALFLTAGCGEVKTGYVDGVRIGTESEVIKTATEEAQAKLDALEQEATTKLNEAVSQGVSDLELQQMQQDFQTRAFGINQEFQTNTRGKVEAAIAEVAKKHEIDIVLKSSKEEPVVLSGGMDLTDEVLEKLK